MAPCPGLCPHGLCSFQTKKIVSKRLRDPQEMHSPWGALGTQQTVSLVTKSGRESRT